MTRLDWQETFNQAYEHAQRMTLFAYRYPRCVYYNTTYKDRTHPNASCLIGGFLTHIDPDIISSIEGMDAVRACDAVLKQSGFASLHSDDSAFLLKLQLCHDSVVQRYHPGTLYDMMANLRRLAEQYGLTIPE